MQGGRYFRGVLKPDDAAAGGGQGEALSKSPAEEPAATGATTPVDYKAELLKLLGLDATADDAAIQAKAGEVQGTLGTVGDLQTQASSAADLQTQLDEINVKYTELNTQQQEIYKAKQEADAGEILKVYEGHFVDDASKAAIRNILLSDKDAGIAILNGLKKPDAAISTADTTDKTDGKSASEKFASSAVQSAPPAPKHDPAAQQSAPSEEEISQKIQARAAELKKGNASMSLTRAYQIAENEIRNVG